MSKNYITELGNTNDDSNGHCYAPKENGEVKVEKKRHFKCGEDFPKGWVIVDCDLPCHFLK